MPRPRKTRIVTCRHFLWRLVNRNGTWYGDGRTNNTNVGRHSLDTKDEQEALRRLHDLDQSRAEDLGLAAKTERPTAAIKTVSLDDGVKIYREHYSRPLVAGGVAPGTQKRYRSALDKFVLFVKSRGVTTWNGITKQLLISYASHLEQTEYAPGNFYLPKTICDDITTVKQCIRHLIEELHLGNMQPIELQMQKPESQRHYCWRPEEVEAMVKLAKDSPDAKGLHPVIVGLACSGLRIGELASLRWGDIDMTKLVVQLTDERGHRSHSGRSRRTVKNHRSRSFPLHPDWAAVLELLPRVDSLVYHGPRGGRLKPDTARNAFKRYMIVPLMESFPCADDEQGFKDGRFHSFRHYFCSCCANNGVPERMVMEWLGHQDSEMIRHYYHLHDEEAKRRMNNLNFLGGADGRSVGGKEERLSKEDVEPPTSESGDDADGRD